MSQILTFGSTVLEGSGKRGILKPMEPGGHYYLMNSGGFNIQNRGGVGYRFNDYVKECMNPDSDLNRRAAENQLWCELGHPPQYFWTREGGRIIQTPITDLYQWIHRLRTVLEPNVCASIRKIHFLMTGGDRDPVHNKVEIRSFGPLKEVFQDSIDDPDMNTAISIRTVTKPQQMGDRNREVEFWTGYDVVMEQGMLDACKHRTAGLEDFLSSALYNPTPAEVVATVDEFLFMCKQTVHGEAAKARFAGTESYERVTSMIREVEQRLRGQHDKKIQVVRSSALSIFK
jgi:hypothetical protein